MNQQSSERSQPISSDVLFPERLRELHLFAGAGGGILGGMLLGHTCVCAVEFEPYPVKILLQRQRDGIFPSFPIWDDIRSFDGSPWKGLVDVVCGGFPCQRFSTAARGRNTAQDLWPEMLRVVEEIEPTFVLAENVSRAAIEIAAEDLRSVDYETRAIALSASDLGGDHIRKRYWLRAYSNLHGELLKPIHAEMAELPFIRPRVWDTYPNEPRMANGVADRLDRIAATGNGQVPIVAATAWRILNQ